jgi:hypothetical protein
MWLKAEQNYTDLDLLRGRQGQGSIIGKMGLALHWTCKRSVFQKQPDAKV